MKEEINAWLDSAESDLQIGIALFAKHGRKSFLKQQFQTRRPGQWVKDKLRYELGQLVGRNVIMEALASAQPTNNVTPAVTETKTGLCGTAQSGDAEFFDVHVKAQAGQGILDLPLSFTATAPVDEDELARRKRSMFSERAKLSNSLHLFAKDDDAGRKAVAIRIKALTKEMNLIRLEQKGELPPIAPVVKLKELPAGLAGLHQERLNLRARISKVRKSFNAQTAGTTGFVKYKNKLEALEAQLEVVEGRLK